jgi:hypothetical protein
VFAGIFPVLLLASSRRKGSLVPQMYYRFVGHPVVLVALYLIFISSLLAHGQLIWQAPFERSAALFTALLVLGMTFLAIRGGALRPRVVVELRRIAQGLALRRRRAGHIDTGRCLPAISRPRDSVESVRRRDS